MSEPAHPVPTPVDEEIEKLVNNHFNDDLLLVCGRVWEAWQVGTMTQDDFHPISEDECVLPEMIEKLSAHLKSAVQAARMEELEGILKYWNDLSMVVPRLQASPPPVRQHIRERLQSLKKEVSK